MQYPVDYFTGNGSTTTFGLSYTPGSATSIIVTINGVKQIASVVNPSYTINGSQLVFTAAPANNAAIEVTYLGILSQVNVPANQTITPSMLSLAVSNTLVYQTTANGSQNVFNMGIPPISANSLIVTANGIIQYDYSVQNANLILNFVPANNTLIRAQSLAAAQQNVPVANSVSSSALQSGLTLTGTTTFGGGITLSSYTANGVLYATGTGAVTTGSNLLFDGTNLTFGTTGQRIYGDFSNSTFASRLAFQTSTANSATRLTVIPSGTGSITALNLHSAADPTNSSVAIMYMVGGTDMRLASGTTGTGTYLPMTFWTNNAEQMRLDTSGNLGLGVTPSAWRTDASTKALQIGYGSFFTQVAGAYFTHLTSNSYQPSSGSNTYVANGYATEYLQTGGQHIWNIAASGTAGNTIPFTQAMTLDNNGRLGVGTTPSGWNSAYKVIQFGIDGTVWAGVSTGNAVGFSKNFYNNGSANLYVNTDYASLYQQVSGQHQWLSAPSATGGTNCNFTRYMTLDASGNLGIGTTSPRAPLDVNGNAYIGASGGTGSINLFSDTSTTGGFIYEDNTQMIISQVTAGPILFRTTNSERARFNSSGSLLLGTTSASGAKMDLAFSTTQNGLVVAPTTYVYPSYSLFSTNGVITTVKSASGNINLIDVRSTEGTTLANGRVTGAYFQIDNPAAAVNANGGQVGVYGLVNGVSNYSAGHQYGVYGRTGSGGTYGVGVMAVLGADQSLGLRAALVAQTDNTSDPIATFRNSNGEQARFDPNGNLLVGATSLVNNERLSVAKANNGGVGVALFVNTNGASGDQCVRASLGANTNNTNSYLYVGTAASTDRFYVYGSGNVVNSNNSYGGLSDVKLKENIVDATPKLDDVMRLQVRNFNFKSDPSHKQIGFIAQEFEQVFPAMVDESNDLDEKGNALDTVTKSIKTSVLIPILVKAIQELKAEFDAYKATHP